MAKHTSQNNFKR